MDKTKELGDFQTPKELATLIAEILKTRTFLPDVIVEPTCGEGAILLEEAKSFPAAKVLGIEIQKDYVDSLSKNAPENAEILNADFFTSYNLIEKFIGTKKKILFAGNPPWVTNSELSAKEGKNLPHKKNFDKLRGIDAITGKSNFDICEYIIMELINGFSGRESVFAFLCKVSVAKKIMHRIWKNKKQYKAAELYPIDSKKYFNAAVKSCFFILDCTEKKENYSLQLYDSIESKKLLSTAGCLNGIYLEDISKRNILKIYGKSQFIWHNGIKHDVAKAIVLDNENDILKNGYGATVDIEDALLFPYLKSSDLANNKNSQREIIVTQRYVGEHTDYIEKKFPKTWTYLMSYKSDFEKRKSVIYKNKPLFSFFSVGEYSFKPYKIAISGLYKNLNFVFLEPKNNKPIMLDDTCNFISFDDYKTAEFIFNLLQSDVVKRYLKARISFDSKRPVTTEILNSIDLRKVAEEIGMTTQFNSLLKLNIQLSLFSEDECIGA